MPAPNGIILIDKPEGKSSYEVVKRVCKILNSRKAGHLGTLDPFATGLLPVLLGEATKIFQFMVGLDKEYEAVLELGKETNTGDLTGKVVYQKDIEGIDAEKIRLVLNSIQGEIIQYPPQFSAKKIDGKPGYYWARRGITKNFKPQKVMVKKLVIKEISPPIVRFNLLVSSGTFVRYLAQLVGRRLGVGAHLRELRRTALGKWKVEDAFIIEELENMALTNTEKIHIILINEALDFMKAVVVSDEDARSIKQGKILKNVEFPETLKEGEFFRFVDKNDNLLSVVCYKANPQTPYIYKRVFNL